MTVTTVRDYYLKNNPEVLDLTDDPDRLIAYDNEHLMHHIGDPEGHPCDENGEPLFEVLLLEKIIGGVGAF